MTRWHVAQLNLGWFRAPLDSEEMAEFRLALDPINAIAESTPGFVWRLTDESGASSSHVDVPGVDDPLVAPNMSVWESVDALRHFMFRSGHATYLRRRREWFRKPDGAHSVLWWIRAGELPTIDDGVRRLDHLDAHGPSDVGWTLHEPFDPPSS